MRILVVGTHPNSRQPSMSLFARWLGEAAHALGNVETVAAPAVFFSGSRAHGPGAKWLAYVDQYLLLTLRLWRLHHRYDLIVVADQGNAPSASLAPRRKLVVMVHDTIAMRQALGELDGAPRTRLPGRLLQRAIRRSVSRAGALLSNPGVVREEIERLRLGRRAYVVGCPADYSRLAAPPDPPAVCGPYLLNVASDGWRKRKRDLIPLWRELEARSGLGLVLAGQTDAATRQAFLDAGLKRVSVLNDVPDAVLANLYRHARGLVIPSHEEGLCIPVLEALHFDKPVFLPDASPSYADFFGAAVRRIDFADPARAAEQLLRGLQAPVDLGAVRRIQAWAEPQAFRRRVVEALKASA